LLAHLQAVAKAKQDLAVKSSQLTEQLFVRHVLDVENRPDALGGHAASLLSAKPSEHSDMGAGPEGLRIFATNTEGVRPVYARHETTPRSRRLQRTKRADFLRVAP